MVTSGQWPSQDRDHANNNNIQSYSFKMLQKALNEGTKVAVSVRFDIFNILTSGHPDIHLSNVHNVHAPKVVEKPKIEGLTLFLTSF